MFSMKQLDSKKIIHLFPPKHVEGWINEEKTFYFKKGEIISKPGNQMKDVYLIIKGHARVFHIHIDGKECVLGLLSPGDFIELLDIFSEKESCAFSEALTDVTLVAISKEKIIKLIGENSSLAVGLLNYFSEKHYEMIKILGQVAYGKVEERLIFLFKKLANPLKGDKGWYPIPLSITHKDIAGMIASTRETVTSFINKLIEAGIIRQHKNRIWIRLD